MHCTLPCTGMFMNTSVHRSEPLNKRGPEVWRGSYLLSRGFVTGAIRFWTPLGSNTWAAF